jgi:starch synthase
MRVAYICADRGVPIFGGKGASIHVRELTRALHALGHDVRIASPRRGGERPAGFDVPVDEQLPADFEPDAIYERYSLNTTAGLRAAEQRRIPLLLEVNAPLADEQERYRRLEDADAARRVERRLIRSATRLIAVSSGIERWLVDAGADPERITVIPNGVDTERFRPRDGAAVRARLGLNDRRVVGFAGSLKPWHDVATLIRALALLPLRPHLLVVGDGPERERLEHQAARAGVAAVFTGAIAHAHVPAHIAALDVAVAPYAADDGFYFSPLKLVEYLAAERPVAAADVGDIRHCVRHGETGCLYTPGDADALAAAIGDLLHDRGRAAAMAAAGRAHVCAEHTWEANARAIVALADAARERERVA